MELITSHEITTNIKGGPKIVFSSYNLTLKEMKNKKRKRVKKRSKEPPLK